MPAAEELKILKLGIIAGGGDLPRQLVEVCKSKDIAHCVVGIKNHVDSVEVDQVFRIGRSSKILKFFKDQNVSDVVFIGSVNRPSLLALWPDWETFKFFLSACLKSLGDDGLLKALRVRLEEEGFQVLGIHQFIPELLMSEGVLGEVKADSQLNADIQLGLKASQELGKADIGQAVIVKGGHVIAREDKNGTNAMIKRYGEEGAILVKTCKPQQDHDLDLPTLGLKTVEVCAEKKMLGIIGQAGYTLLADRDGMIEAANENDIFVMGVSIYE